VQGGQDTITAGVLGLVEEQGGQPGGTGHLLPQRGVQLHDHLATYLIGG
jgi:hypothetical protein